MKALFAALGLAVLAGCSLLPGTAKTTDAAYTRWVCDSGAEVLWRYTDAQQSAVDVRLGGAETIHHLSPEPGASGSLYSDGMLAFHTKGDEGLVYWVATDDLIGRGCKAP